MKKILLLLSALLLTLSHAPAALAACSITGSSGSASFGATVITGVSIAPNYFGTHLVVTACDVVGSFCDSDIHVFDDVHWTPAHTTNGTVWAGSKAYPLRRVKVSQPGCMLSSPDKWCLDLEGDNDFGDHVNLLQNGERFLFDRYVPSADIEAPVGGAIVKFAGMGTSPINTWRMNYTNAAGTGVTTKNWTFTTPGC